MANAGLGGGILPGEQPAGCPLGDLRELHSLSLSIYHNTVSSPQRGRFKSLIFQHYENRSLSE